MKSYTDIEQSRKLAEILPLESADYCWGIDNETLHYNNSPYPCAWKDYTCKEYYIPCWSLAALRNLLPSAIKSNKDSYLFESHNTFDNSWVYRYYNEDDTSYLYCKNTNEVDACYDLIIKLYEKDLL